MNNYQPIKKSKTSTLIFLVVSSVILCLGTLSYSKAFAQEKQILVLTLARDFGYSSGTGKIQGTFSMKVTTEVELQKVIFFIDDQAIGEDDQAPFKIQFNTDNFPLGERTMHARGYDFQGEEYASNEIHAIFVTEDEGWQAALKIIVPVFCLIIGGMLISFALPLIFGRGKPKRITLPERFGILGGAICPKCHLPFNIPVLKINLVVGSLLPCPHCGKWSIVRRASTAELQAALEAAKIQQNSDISVFQSEEKIKKEIDDSRYIDL